MSKTNKTRHIQRHETCKCKCILDAGGCNKKQRWNDNKGRYECKELIDKGVCDKESIWNSSNCECECDKSYDVGVLDYEKFKCSKKSVDTLIEECTENIEEPELAKITLAEHENKHKCSSCSLRIVIFLILFTINVGIGRHILYLQWYLKKMLLMLIFVPVLKQRFDKLINRRS